MSQYFLPLIINKNDKATVYSLLFEKAVSTLCSHSNVYNIFMGRMMRRLTIEPSYVMWVGDYAYDNDYGWLFEKFNLNYNKIQKLQEVKLKYEPFSMGEYKETFLINYTQHTYINFAKFMEIQGLCKTFFHPLSLLTAVGNGKSGDDYFGNNMEWIGKWAGNLIGVKFEEPKEGYKEIDGLYFDEDYDEALYYNKKDFIPQKRELKVFIEKRISKFKKATQKDFFDLGVNANFLWESLYNEMRMGNRFNSIHSRKIFIAKEMEEREIQYYWGK